MWHADMPEEYRNEIICGDARVLSERIPDNSVDLIFTDPVYDRIEDYAWLAETAARVLRPGGALLAFYETRSLPQTIEALGSCLNFRWQFIEYRANEVKIRPAPGGRTLYTGLLWFDKDKARPKFVWDVKSVSMNAPPNATNHAWSKPPQTVVYYLNAFTTEGAIVFDPFTGGGTVPAVCKMLNRNWIAFEIDPATADRARTRVAQTQAMHPVLLGVQEPMELAV